MVRPKQLAVVRMTEQGRVILTVRVIDRNDQGIEVRVRRDTSMSKEWLAGVLLLAVEPLLEPDLSVKATSMFMALAAKKTKGSDTVLPF